MKDAQPPEDPVWVRIDDELTRRRDKRLRPSSWAELSRWLETTEQRLNNWRRRGVPARSYPELADALGWTVDQLLAREPAPKHKPTTEPPELPDQLMTLLQVFGGLTEQARLKVLKFAQDQAGGNHMSQNVNQAGRLDKGQAAARPRTFSDQEDISAERRNSPSLAERKRGAK